MVSSVFRPLSFSWFGGLRLHLVGGVLPARPGSWPLLFGVAADSISAQAKGWSCPAGRAFFLSLNKKKQKVNTGAAPLCTRKGQGQM